MKTVAQARAAVAKYLSEQLHTLVAGGPSHDRWPWRLALGKPATAQLQDQWEQIRDNALAWRRIEPTLQPESLIWETRRIHKLNVELPTHVEFATLSAAAAFAGGSSIALLRALSERWDLLTDRFPNTATAATLRSVAAWDIVDVQIALNAADWFRANPTPDSTWTPRMVPVPGLHAKWLDQSTRRRVIAALAGVPTLTLRDRPSQVHITYLDPHWNRGAGRRYDVITAEDTYELPYAPQVVVISENRDTALYFPDLPGGIAVRGDGDRVLRWVANSPLADAPHIFYWGDMDTDGLEIVNGLRVREMTVSTIFMDCQTYDAYHQFGADTDRSGRPIKVPHRKELAKLTDAEQALYHRLTDPGWPGRRRIEQERIPLALAARAIMDSCHGSL